MMKDAKVPLLIGIAKLWLCLPKFKQAYLCTFPRSCHYQIPLVYEVWECFVKGYSSMLASLARSMVSVWIK